MSNEFGKFAQDNKYGVKSIDTIDFIDKNNSLKNVELRNRASYATMSH